MRLVRPLSAGVAALAVVAGLTGPAVAQTAPSGLGTSLSSTKVLTAQLGSNGSLLDLSLLTDEAQATLDSAVAAPGSFSRLALGKVSSTIVPTDAVNKVLPTFEAKSTGPTSTDVTGGALALASPVLNGTVQGGTLTATLENGVASSGLTAEVVNLTDVVGGLLKVASAKTTLAAQAAGDNSNASRSASINDITVLDLGAILQGLGIDLGALSVTQLAGLVDSLGAQTGLPLPSGSATLTSAVDQLNAAIDDLEAAIAGSPAATTDITTAIDTTTSTLLGTIGVTSPLPTTTDTLATATTLVTDVIADLQAELDTLVTDGVKALDNIALLRLEGVEVGVATKAVQDVNASTATVVGKIGKVTVGNKTIAEGLDVLGAATTLTDAVAKVNTAISGVLGVVSPDLANLVKVSVLEKATEVATKNGYSTASAGVTALTATITPPASLSTIVSTIQGAVATVLDVAEAMGVADAQAVIDELGLSTSMTSLRSTLSLGFGALSQPATVKVAQVLSASNYRVGSLAAPGTPGSTPTLPRTGGDTMLLTAAAAIVIGLIGRRILLTPEPKPVRIRK